MYYFIVNYTGGSGNARRTWNKVHYLLNEKNIEYKAYVTKKPGHAKKLAEKISSFEDEDIRLIVVGGDGTINEVLNGVKDLSKIRFGIIPTGSGNDFARGMGLPVDTIRVLDIILNSIEGKTIDLGEVTTGDGDKRIFGISSGIGLDAIVCKKTIDSKLKKVLNKLRIGKLTYLVLTVTSLFSMETYDVKVQMKLSEDKKVVDGFETEDVEEIDFSRLIFLAAMNQTAEGGGVPMCPNALNDDGKISICAASGITKLKAFLTLPKLVKAKHVGRKGFLLQDVESMILDADREMVLHADGEYVGDVKHIEIRVLKNALNVLV